MRFFSWQDKTKQNGECMFESLDIFSSVWVLSYQYSKSLFLQVTFNFEFAYMNTSRFSNSNFAHYFDFHCFLRKVSMFGGWFLFSVNYYFNFEFTLEDWSMNNIMVRKICVRMFYTINIYLLQFKIQNHLQKGRVWIRFYQYIRTHSEDKTLNMSNYYIRHFAFFSSKSF